MSQLPCVLIHETRTEDNKKARVRARSDVAANIRLRLKAKSNSEISNAKKTNHTCELLYCGFGTLDLRHAFFSEGTEKKSQRLPVGLAELRC